MAGAAICRAASSTRCSEVGCLRPSVKQYERITGPCHAYMEANTILFYGGGFFRNWVRLNRKCSFHLHIVFARFDSSIALGDVSLTAFRT